MRRSYFMLLSFAVALCFSCKREIPKEVEIVSLAPDMKIDMLSDSTFFGLILCLEEYDGDIYMSMDQRMQIARMDKDLNLKNTIGRKGRGPGEFSGSLTSFFVVDDEVWVGDQGRAVFVKFTPEGKFISSGENSRGLYAGMNSRFAVEAGKNYFSEPSHDNGTSITMLDVKNDSDANYVRFGELGEFDTPNRMILQNIRHIFVHDDNIIAVPASIPIIERYDKNTLELTETFDVTSIPEMEEWYKNAINAPNLSKPSSIFTMMKDAYLHDDLLYVLYFSNSTMLAKTPQEYIGALVFDVGGGEIEYVRRYTFGGDDLMNICVTDDYIYAAPPVGGVIKRYPLKQ